MRNSKKLSAIILSAIMLATGCTDNTAPGESTEIKENSSVATENSGRKGYQRRYQGENTVVVQPER